MQLEIAKKIEMPLLSRTRVTAWATSDAKTPSRVEVLNDLAQKLHTDPQLIIVKHIYQRFGMQKAKVVAHVYKDAETLQTVEEPHVVKKHRPKSDVKEDQAAPQEAVAAEKK